MDYNQLKHKNDAIFRRSTGVKKATFDAMLQILEVAYEKKKSKGGRKSKLTVTQMLLMTLEYLREYRTYLKIGLSYGVSESSAYKNIIWVEDTLIKSKLFKLPGKKALYNTSPEDIILIDVTESPIERPKKNKKNITQAKRNDTH
jgi:hypothetical protein